MKKILLAVEDRKTITGLLSGYDVDLVCSDYDGMTQQYKALGMKGIFADIIVQVDEDRKDRLRALLSCVDYERSDVLVLADEITTGLTEFLKQQGIACLMTVEEFSSFPEYVVVASQETDQQRDSVILYDDNHRRIHLVKNIAGHFPCDVYIASNMDELFTLAQDVQGSLLVNLGATGFNIKEFVKRATVTDIMKYTPFIPFKHRDEGVYVEEIYSGLHRFARVILSADELYSFLVDVLFKKEYFSSLKALVKTYDYHDNMPFVDSSLKKLYYSFGADLFGMDHIVGNNMFDKVDGKIKEVQQVMSKFAGLKWLLQSTGSQATCGWGGGIQNQQ